jgi:hypothetical protein
MDDTTKASDERDQGRMWVERLLTRLLAERGLRFDSPIRWTPDFDREIYTMEARMGGAEKIWRLSYEALEDCVAQIRPLFRPRAFGSGFLWSRARSPSDNAVRPRMDGHIRKYRSCG